MKLYESIRFSQQREQEQERQQERDAQREHENDEKLFQQLEERFLKDCISKGTGDDVRKRCLFAGSSALTCSVLFSSSLLLKCEFSESWIDLRNQFDLLLMKCAISKSSLGRPLPRAEALIRINRVMVELEHRQTEEAKRRHRRRAERTLPPREERDDLSSRILDAQRIYTVAMNESFLSAAWKYGLDELAYDAREIFPKYFDIPSFRADAEMPHSAAGQRFDQLIQVAQIYVFLQLLESAEVVSKDDFLSNYRYLTKTDALLVAKYIRHSLGFRQKKQKNNKEDDSEDEQQQKQQQQEEERFHAPIREFSNMLKSFSEFLKEQKQKEAEEEEEESEQQEAQNNDSSRKKRTYRNTPRKKNSHKNNNSDNSLSKDVQALSERKQHFLSLIHVEEIPEFLLDAETFAEELDELLSSHSTKRRRKYAHRQRTENIRHAMKDSDSLSTLLETVLTETDSTILQQSMRKLSSTSQLRFARLCRIQDQEELEEDDIEENTEKQTDQENNNEHIESSSISSLRRKKQK